MVTISHRDGEEELFLSFESGASGYLSQNAPPPELVRAIRTVWKGGGYFDMDLARKVIEKY